MARGSHIKCVIFIRLGDGRFHFLDIRVGDLVDKALGVVWVRFWVTGIPMASIWLYTRACEFGSPHTGSQGARRTSCW
jgi:hypothetical protein